jgi:serine/threonine protein kinase
MIKQSGHDKTLDIWNLGVLMFELLTGSPPFEGANQNALFENILKFKIKWPKGFSGIARDLVTKLLKINPAERIPLDEVINHPWFKSLAPLKPVDAIPTTIAPKQIDLSTNVKKEDYQVVSKPSIQNKNETKNQSEIMSKKAKEVTLSSQ